MLRAIALDDEPPALQVIEYFCGQTPGIFLQGAFSRADEALQYLLQNPTDLLFLDINMPAMSGMEFRRSVPAELMVIFTTAYAEFAVEGFNLSALDYLLKPFTQERFAQAVRKAQEYQQMRQSSQRTAVSEYLLVKADYSVYKIPIADILYIEGLDDYLRIFAVGIKPVVARLTMKALLTQLPTDDFVRVHRSYIVPMSRIEAVRNKAILLKDREIPIGASYEADFFAKFGL